MAVTVEDLPRALADALGDGVRTVAGLFHAPACSVALVAADGLRYVASHGAGEAAILGTSVPFSQGIAGWVATSGTTVAVADVSEDPRFAREVAEATGYVPRTVLAAPLPGADGPAGVLSVLDPAERAADLDLLGALAAMLGGTLRQTRSGGPLDEVLEVAAELGPRAQELAADLVRVVAAHQPPRRR